MYVQYSDPQYSTCTYVEYIYVCTYVYVHTQHIALSCQAPPPENQQVCTYPTGNRSVIVAWSELQKIRPG